MLNLNQLHLSEQENLALSEVKNKLLTEFPIEKILIFGSVARNEATEESDLDLLLIAKHPLTFQEKYAISDLYRPSNK